MKFAFMSDIHLSKYGNDKEDDENTPERLGSIKKTLYFIMNYCQQNNIPNIIIGGDILHGKSIIYAVAQNLMLDFFEEMSSFQFFVLDGNHDLSGKGDLAVSALRPLKNIPNVTWITKTPLKTDNIIFIPYTSNIDEIVKQNSGTILVSHFGLNEAVVNSGISIRTNIKTSDLVGKYQLVLLGHYHKPQEIITDQIKILYSGSIIQLDWGEKDDEKRFLVVDSKKLDVQSILTEGYKKYIELKINESNKNQILETAEKIQNSGDHVRIVKTENVSFKKELDKFIVIDKTQKDITDRGITSSMSQIDKHKRFLEIKNIPSALHQTYLDVATRVINKSEENK
jgi:DNA repair exonuclease SbcCD nuclease subunit